MEITIESRIDDQDGNPLTAIAILLSTARRSYFVDRWIHDKPLNFIKSSYQIKFGITARHFNAIRVEVDGIVSSYKKLLIIRIDEVKDKIKLAKKKLKKVKSDIKKHSMQRKFKRLQTQLESLEQDKKSKTIKVCFGTKKLFNAQHFLKENGLASHEEWLKLWQDSRNDSFYCLGSKDESQGNQTCQLKNHILTLRVPHALVGQFSKTIQIPVMFQENLKHQLENAIKSGQAISYRFKRKGEAWYVYATTERVEVKLRTSRLAGAIGADFNQDHIAIYEIDRNGNPIRTVSRIPIDFHGKRSHQTKTILGNACAEIVRQASSAGKPLVIEELDFRKKKMRLADMSSKAARKLSSFAYKLFSQILHSRAQKEGIEVIDVNAAFTSIIGKHNWSKELGISGHAGAAIAIARRGLRMSERPRRYGTSSGPVRNRSEHVWRYWSAFRSRRGSEPASSGDNTSRRSALAPSRLARRCIAGPSGKLEEIGGSPIASRDGCSPDSGNTRFP